MQTELQSNAARLTTRQEEIVERLQLILASLERGQSQQPLTQSCRRLRARADQQHVLQLSVVAVTRSSLGSLLTWFGANAQQVSQLAQMSADSLLRWHTGGKGVAEKSPWGHLNVLAAHVDGLCQAEPDRFQAFCSHGQLLLLATDSQEWPAPEAAAVLNELLTCFPVVLPVRLGEPAADWRSCERLSFPPDQQVLPELVLPADRKCWLQDSQHPTRRGLWLRSTLAATETTVASTASRLEREGRYVSERLADLDSEEPAARSHRSRKEDKRPDAIRKFATTGLSDLEDRVNLENERLVQPLGGLSHLVRDAAHRIRLEDLSREVSVTAIRLRLRSHQVSSYNRKIVDALQGQLRTDLGKMDAELTRLEADVQTQFDEAYGEKPDLRLSRLEFQRVWERVENLIDVGEEATIELPRRTIFELMGAGRQKVFFLIMFIALLGRMGIDEQVLRGFLPPDLAPALIGWLKAGFMVVLFSTCLGAMFNALLTWREEKVEQTGRELGRIRETLIGDAQKAVELIQKEKRNVMRGYFKSLQDDLGEWLTHSAQSQAAREEAAAERRQRELQQIRDALHQRQRELATAGQNVQTLKHAVSQLRTDCQSMIEAALAPPHSGEVLRALQPTRQEGSLPPPEAEPIPPPVSQPEATDPAKSRRPRASAPGAPGGERSAVTSTFAQRRAARQQSRPSS